MKNVCFICAAPTQYGCTYCSLSCSNKSRLAKNRSKYDLNPKRCKQCETPIPYEKRHTNTYCTQSCAACSTNRRFPKRKPAQKPPKIAEVNLARFNEGLINNRNTIRRWLTKLVGNFCHLCNLTPNWNAKPLVMVVDHIDGNASNNKPNNLRLLCPNCNSQTPTFCGRNIGRGRQSLGLPKS